MYKNSNAPVRINCLVIENAFGTMAHIQEQVTAHFVIYIVFSKKKTKKKKLNTYMLIFLIVF